MSKVTRFSWKSAVLLSIETIALRQEITIVVGTNKI
jgi:hypothetical protein